MSTADEERVARFEDLRAELATLDDDALKARFWQLCEEVMTPVVDFSRTHTTPSIERSVLLRMGIDSVTTHAVVENVLNAGLLGKGAGHAVLRLSPSRRHRPARSRPADRRRSHRPGWALRRQPAAVSSSHSTAGSTS